MTSKDGPIFVYDGLCVLCSGFVGFILKHDRQGVFRFASTASEAGAGIMRSAGIDPNEPSSNAVVSGSQIHLRSDAFLEVMRLLGSPWSCLRVLAVIPRPWRDAFYLMVARNRYRIFGRHDSCFVPDSSVRSRFLDAESLQGIQANERRRS